MEKDTFTARAATILTPVKLKDHGQQDGPHRNRSRRIVVPRDFPVADEEMADCRACPPAFIGELCLVEHPGRVVGKICPQPREAHQAENERERQKDYVQPAFRWLRDIIPAPHLSPGIVSDIPPYATLTVNSAAPGASKHVLDMFVSDCSSRSDPYLAASQSLR